MEKRYKVLRIIGTIYKILGLISLIVTILLVVGICAGSIWGMTAIDSLTDTMNGYGSFGLPGMLGGMASGFLFSLVMIINLLFAGFFGAIIPLGLKRASIDPAVASSVLLTTVTDVVGFFAFLGLARIILL
jgi:Mg/Co/Ni transporter MgtE